MNTTKRLPHDPSGRGVQQKTGQVLTAHDTASEAYDGQLTLGQEPPAEPERTPPVTPPQTPRTGLQRAQDNADEWWWKVAMRALKWLAAAPGTFESYDLTLIGVPDPASPKHWGALFSAAAKAGVIEPAGFTVARRPTRAGGISRVWRGTGQQ